MREGACLKMGCITLGKTRAAVAATGMAGFHQRRRFTPIYPQDFYPPLRIWYTQMMYVLIMLVYTHWPVYGCMYMRVFTTKFSNPFFRDLPFLHYSLISLLVKTLRII